MRSRFNLVWFTALACLLLASCTSSLWGQPATARDYTLDMTRAWHITKSAEPANLVSGRTAVAWYDVGWCDGSTCPDYGHNTFIGAAVPRKSNGTVMTGYPSGYFGCYSFYDAAADRATYGFLFQAADGAWPTAAGGNPQWPATIECTASGYNVDGLPGNDTLLVTLPLAAAIDSDWAGDPPATLVIATGVTLTLQGVSSSDRIGAVQVAKTLPAGTYVDAIINAKKGGVTWTGVTVEIDESGSTDYITYRVSESAAEGTGQVTFSKNGTNVTSPIVVDRLY